MRYKNNVVLLSNANEDKDSGLRREWDICNVTQQIY